MTKQATMCQATLGSFGGAWHFPVRLLGLCLLGLLFVTALPGQSAYGEAVETGVAPEAIEGYEDDFGVDSKTATENLSRQQMGAGMALGLRETQGANYAGVWFDNKSGEFVVPMLPQTNAREVDQAIQGAHLANHARTTIVQNSWSKLEASQEATDSALQAMIETGAVRTSLDPRTNAVVIEVASPASEKELRLVEDVASSARVNTEVKLSDEPTLGLENLSCAAETKICTKPLRGGVAIAPSSLRNYDCTGAFKAIGNQFGNRFLLTAGHCEGSKWWTEGPVTEPHEIGVVQGKVYPGGDWEAINANGGYWDTTPWPSMVAFWNHGAEAQETSIQAESASYPGEYVCHSGLTTGGTCSYVTTMNATAQVSGGRLEYHLTLAGSACAEEGDSGGPVFAGNVALGIVSAGAGACGQATMAYVEITEADDSMGVTVGPRLGLAPFAESRPAEHVEAQHAEFRGELNPHGIETNYWFDYGTTPSFGASTPQVGAGAGWQYLYIGTNVTLEPATTYYYRFAGHNGAGTSYGTTEQFTTPTAPPRANTEPATNVKKANATLNGSVNPDGLETDYHFDWGTTTAYGSSTTSTVLGSGNTFSPVSATLSGLKEEQIYHYRVVAHNSLGTVYGSDRTFTEPRLRPAAVTLSTTNAGETAVTLRGTVNPEESDTHYQFEYGSTVAYGTTIPIPSKDVGEGTSPVEVSQLISGLIARTTYHYRVTASNTFGTATGADQIFTPGWVLQSPVTAESSTKSYLFDTSCSEPTFCVAVGRYKASTGGERALAEKWNGTSWELMSLANPPGTILFTGLETISCSAKSFCVAGGFYINSASETLPFVEKWDGTKWEAQTLPNPSKTTAYPKGMSCISSVACEAVGYGYNGSANVAKAWRWNGSTWKEEAAASVEGAKASYLYSVSCTSATVCQAVGQYQDGTGKLPTLAERWNGTGWEVKSSPNESGSKQGRLLGVSCLSASFCEAAGFSETSTGKVVSLAAKWNGTSWELQLPPNPESSPETRLYDVSCDSVTSCEGVGVYQDSASQWITYAEHWNGTKWEAQSPPHPPSARYTVMQSVSCVSAVCEAVGVEEVTAGGPYFPLAEKY